jgi:O-antigen/teichoic acid export membrane protein
VGQAAELQVEPCSMTEAEKSAGVNSEDPIPVQNEGIAMSPPDGVRSIRPVRVRAVSWLTRTIHSASGLIATRGVLILTDQAIVSGTNFLTTLILGRVCLPEQLGIYSNVFMLFLVLSALPNALAWMPYTSFSPHMSKEARSGYAGNVTAVTVGICFAASVGMVIASIVAGTTGKSADVAQVLAFFAVASAFMLLREHSRRISLAGMDMGRLLAVDSIAAAIQVGGLAILLRAGILSAASVYAAIAISGCVAFAFWLYSMRGQIGIKKRLLRPDIVKNWRFGRWILASSVVATLGNAAFTWMLMALHGPKAAGLFAAALSIVFFANPFLIGVRNLFAPLTAQVYASGGALALQRLVARSSLGLVLLLSPFVLIVTYWGGFFIEALFGSEYSGQGPVLVGICLSLLADTATIPMSFALTAIDRAQYMLGVSVVKLVVTATVGAWLVYRYGPTGAGYASFIAVLPAVVMQWLALRHLLRPGNGQGIQVR